jgi:hypothetical protein
MQFVTNKTMDQPLAAGMISTSLISAIKILPAMPTFPIPITTHLSPIRVINKLGKHLAGP